MSIHADQQIKSCPECGSEAEYSNSIYDDPKIECQNCGYSVESYPRNEDESERSYIIKLWNKSNR